MLVVTLIVFLILDAAWILYAMKTAPVIDDEEVEFVADNNSL